MATTLKRREVMRLLALTIGGSALLPEFSVGKIPDHSRKIFIPAGEGKKAKMGVNDIVFKLDKSQTAGNLGSSEIFLYPGILGSIPHYHNTFDEVCVVLEGAVTIKVENDIDTVSAGGWHLRPRGSVHSFWNSGTVGTRFIELYIPAGHEAFMRHLTDFFIDDKIPTHEQVTELGNRYDTHFKWDLLPGILKKYNLHL